MKLDNDCIRDILISIEAIEYGAAYTVEKLHELLPNYSYDKLQYHCIQLLDAGLIKAISMPARGSYTPQVNRITDLTYPGHQFLANIREDNNWKKIKGISSSIGFAGLKVISSIAEGVATAAINKHLGFSEQIQ